MAFCILFGTAVLMAAIGLAIYYREPSILMAGVVIGGICFLIAGYEFNRLRMEEQEENIISDTCESTDNMGDSISTNETAYKLGEILESDDNYVVISDEDKVAIISKDMVTFEISDTEMVIVDEDGDARFM